MLLIGTRNTTTQTVPAGSALLVGDVYRRYCKKNSCGVPAFATNLTSIAAQHGGIYHVTANVTFTAPVAGVITFQLTQGDVPIPGAIASETITTATTEVRTTTIDFYVLVNNDCVLGTPTIIGSNIGVTNTGALAATVTNYVLNVSKEV